MEKEKRLRKIVSLIEARPIGTQRALATQLERLDIAVTQSSVSRDLEELGVIKKGGRYLLPQRSIAKSGITLLDLQATGDALIVAKCERGLASAVAERIDSAGLTEIVGTIAGENTIFIAVTNRKAQRAVVKKLWQLFA